MTFIVTGANGFIGSQLTRKLLEKNHSVYAIDLSFTEDRLGSHPKLSKIESSLENVDTWKSLLPTAVDTFYHLAWRGVNGKEKADPVIQTQNIATTLAMAKLAKEIGCGKFLCAGTIAERTVESLSSLDRTSGGMLYGAAKHSTHLLLETYCKSVGLDLVWMQFSNIYGPKNRTGNLVGYTIGELKNGREATFGPACQPYDFVYLEDLLEAVYRLGVQTTKKHFYYIGSGSPRILGDYLSEIGRVCGQPENIKIGVRPDDGIKYDFKMFDNQSLIEDIGEYVKEPFSSRIIFTVEND